MWNKSSLWHATCKYWYMVERPYIKKNFMLSHFRQTCWLRKAVAVSLLLWGGNSFSSILPGTPNEATKKERKQQTLRHRRDKNKITTSEKKLSFSWWTGTSTTYQNMPTSTNMSWPNVLRLQACTVQCMFWAIIKGVMQTWERVHTYVLCFKQFGPMFCSRHYEETCFYVSPFVTCYAFARI